MQSAGHSDGTSDSWTLEVFVDDNGDVPFQRFLDKLSEPKFTAINTALRRVLAARGLDLARTEWLKPIGSGLHEFRVRHNALEINRMLGSTIPDGVRPESVLLRVFVHFHGSRIVLLIGGYDKGADPSERRQQRAIREARKALEHFKEQERRTKRTRPSP